jgi:hypothetical protein
MVSPCQPARPRGDEFEHELERRTLVSEQWRAVLLGALLTAILVVRLVYQGGEGIWDDALRGGSYLLVLACWIGLEALTVVLLRESIRRGSAIIPYQAYVNAALEVAMPTTALAMMCQFDRPLNVLTNSVNYAYFLILILSPLRLDAWLCVFTGATAAAGYGALVAWYHGELLREWVGSSDVMHLSFLMPACSCLSRPPPRLRPVIASSPRCLRRIGKRRNASASGALRSTRPSTRGRRPASLPAR